MSFYLLEYLRFLSKAGHHTLFSLPDFDDNDSSLRIDFSDVATRSVPVNDIHGISVIKINTFLSTAWMDAASLLRSSQTAGDIKTILAGYSGSSGGGGVFDHNMWPAERAPRSLLSLMGSPPL